MECIRIRINTQGSVMDSHDSPSDRTTEVTSAETKAETKAEPTSEPKSGSEATTTETSEGAHENTTAEALDCPHCGRWALKDERCNWVCCGLDTGRGFVARHGCGRQFCFRCGRRLCGLLYDPETGAPTGASTSHDAACCAAEAFAAGLSDAEAAAAYCPGGHNAHAAPRDVAAAVRALCLPEPADS